MSCTWFRLMQPSTWVSITLAPYKWIHCLCYYFSWCWHELEDATPQMRNYVNYEYRVLRNTSYSLQIQINLTSRSSETPVSYQSSKNWICSLQKSILKLIFAGYTGSENSIWNRQTWFFQLDFLEIKYRSTRSRSC